MFDVLPTFPLLLHLVAWVLLLRLLRHRRDAPAFWLLSATAISTAGAVDSWIGGLPDGGLIARWLLPCVLIATAVFMARPTTATPDLQRSDERLKDAESFDRTLEILRVSEEKFAKAFHASPDAITLSTLADGKFHEVNPSFREITGYSREEALGRTSADLGLWTNVGDRRQLVEAIRRDGFVREMESIFRHKDGSLRHCQISAEIIELEQEPNLLFIVRDVTDKRQAEAERDRFISELETKNAELERFAYTVSHDLRSPLVTIQGFLGPLRQDAQAGNFERMDVDMQRIASATRTMQRLLDEILELSRVGRVVNEPSSIELSELVRETQELVDGALSQAGVEVEIHDDLPTVWGDRQRLLEVLQNLLENAVKFRGDHPNPRIEVGWRWDKASDSTIVADGEPPRSEPVIFVRDNGIGIAERYREKVFGLFERLANDVQGTGIGLALVKRILEVHGGRVWVESPGVGHGSTFCFVLPSRQDSPLSDSDDQP